MNNLCRTCLTPKACFSYYIFDNISADTFRFCTSLQVQPEEDMPKALCDTCFKLLTKYSEFKQKCIESQKTLLHYSTTIKTDINSDLKDCVNHITTNKKNDLEECVNMVIVNEYNDLLKNGTTNEKNVSNHCVRGVLINENVKHPVKDECNDLKDNGTGGILVKKNNVLSAEPINNKVENTTSELKFKEEILEDDYSYCEDLVLTNCSDYNFVKIENTLTETNGDCTENESLKSCELCGKVFKYSKCYEVHKKKHEKNPFNECKKCKKTFTTRYSLNRHAESCLSVVCLSSLTCKQCGSVHASKHSLKQHLKAHETRKVHICDICGRRFATYRTLEVHLKTHSNRKKDYTCEHCGKKFFCTKTMYSHRRVHSDQRFICGICGISFKHKFNLSKHILSIHEGKKPHKCDICQKSFPIRTTLTEHMRTHSGERPFPCSLCSKKFLSKRRLRDHYRTHTGEKPHKCNFCEERFIQRSSLKRHLKVHGSF